MVNQLFKITSLVSLIFLFSNKTLAQIDKVSYSEDTKAVMNANIHNGKSKFEGITGKITIQCEEVKLTAAAKQNIITKIKAIDGVINCETISESFQIVITRKAEEGCSHYAEFKDIIANENIRILSNSEVLFH